MVDGRCISSSTSLLAEMVDGRLGTGLGPDLMTEYCLHFELSALEIPNAAVTASNPRRYPSISIILLSWLSNDHS